MPPGEDSVGERKAEIRRLKAELEQALSAAESRDHEMLVLSSDLLQLRDHLDSRAQAQIVAENAAKHMRQMFGRVSASLSALKIKRVEDSATEEELRVAVEELEVLTAELEESNEALRLVNLELERRVSARTADLAAANATLAQHNQALEQRIAREVAARESAQAAHFHQQKLEALGQLTGGVAHDFNNLLTVVMSALHLLQRAEAPERRARLLAHISDAAQRGASLTHRLLAFGRRQSLRPEPLDLQAGIAELGELLAHSLRGDMRIRTRAPPDLWTILVDHGALELALLNLAVNSRDAMPQGGDITLTACNRQIAAEEATAMELQAGNYVEIQVTDTGAGMTPDVLARVFEPFFTTKPVGQGSGLGLAQVYGFARQSGGTATVDSAVDAGCTVSILLPADETAAGVTDGFPGFAEPAASPPTPVSDLVAGAAVLLVEDDPEVAALVSDMLVQYGHAVTRVGSGEAALGALANDRSVDLLFTDVLLPGGRSGLDLAREAERRRPGLPILLTSGYGGESIDQIREERWPLLRKPYRPEQLREAVAAALDRR